MTGTDWRTLASCAGTDPGLFFPRTGSTDDAARARAVCRSCPVRAECLAESLVRPEQHGIWAGTNPGQRRSLRRATR